MQNENNFGIVKIKKLTDLCVKHSESSLQGTCTTEILNVGFCVTNRWKWINNSEKFQYSNNFFGDTYTFTVISHLKSSVLNVKDFAIRRH